MYTAEENNIRKGIFKWVRENKHTYSLNKTNAIKHFGRSKIALKAIDEAIFRVKSTIVNETPSFIKYIREKCRHFADALPSSNYSMGEEKSILCKAIGGKFGEEIISYADHRSYYAKSCIFRPTHGDVFTYFKPSDIKGLFLSGGVLTRILKPITKYIFRAEIIVFHEDCNKQHKINGEITFHYEQSIFCRFNDQEYHADNLASARIWVAEQKKYVVSQKTKHKAIKRVVTQLLKRKFVYQDSIKTGNCTAGSDAFCSRHNLNRHSTITGKDLWILAKDDIAGDYARRIITTIVYKETGVQRQESEVYINNIVFAQ